MDLTDQLDGAANRGDILAFGICFSQFASQKIRDNVLARLIHSHCIIWVEFYTDGTLGNAFNDTAHSGSLAKEKDFQIGASNESSFDDLRMYEPALLDSWIQELAVTPKVIV